MPELASHPFLEHSWFLCQHSAVPHSSHQLPRPIFPLFIVSSPPMISTLIFIMNLTLNIQDRFVTHTPNPLGISHFSTQHHQPSHRCSSQKPVSLPCCLPPSPSLPTCNSPANPVSFGNVPKCPPFLPNSTASYLAPRPSYPARTFLTT